MGSEAGFRRFNGLALGIQEQMSRTFYCGPVDSIPSTTSGICQGVQGLVDTVYRLSVC